MSFKTDGSTMLPSVVVYRSGVSSTKGDVNATDSNWILGTRLSESISRVHSGQTRILSGPEREAKVKELEQAGFF